MNNNSISIPFRACADESNPIWCFAAYENVVLAGTGPYGKILVSNDSDNWREFAHIDDYHVRSLCVVDDNLFIGTMPFGKIYIYNFTRQEMVLSWQAQESEITSIKEAQGKVYAASSAGNIYYFDGKYWQKEVSIMGHGKTLLFKAKENIAALRQKSETYAVKSSVKAGWELAAYRVAMQDNDSSILPSLQSSQIVISDRQNNSSFYQPNSVVPKKPFVQIYNHNHSEYPAMFTPPVMSEDIAVDNENSVVFINGNVISPESHTSWRFVAHIEENVNNIVQINNDLLYTSQNKLILA